MADPANLEQTLRTVEPAVRLVPERHLRRLLLYLRDHGQVVPANPDLPFWGNRDELLAVDVLTESVFTGDEPRLLLLTTADDRLLDDLPRPELLRAYWRLLFQAGVMAAIDAKLATGELTPPGCAERLVRFGPAPSREIRYVLEADHLIDPAAGPDAVYRVFAATYLDLHAFAPVEIADYFPSLPAPTVVLAVLGQDIDGPTVLARTRPIDAAPTRPKEATPNPSYPAESIEREALAAWRTESVHLVTQAEDAERHSNHVRAAILYTHAVAANPGRECEPTSLRARTSLGKLIRQLGNVLDWDYSVHREWEEALTPLLERAAAGNWPRAARCLYELQKIPADLSGEVFTVDLVECVRTLGRRPVKRPLPHARDVMLLNHLRVAYQQFLRSGLGNGDQLRLDRLFHHEMHRVEHDIRQSLTPVITAALTESGFRPATQVEEVARAKAVAELLDRVCERGYLRFGDLRDAVARNQIKMPDLAGPGELLTGDPLLRADTRLAYALDGVYRRGEFYLRGLQRASSVFFGTRPGRFLTLYLIAPFLAAFLTLTFALELEHIGGKIVAFASKILAPKPPPTKTVTEYGWDENGQLVSWDHEEFVNVAQQAATSSETPIPDLESIFVFGVFLFLVFHVPPFRRALASVLRGLWRAVRFVVWELPGRIARSPAVVAVWYSRPARFVNRHLGGAIVLTTAVVGLLAFLGATTERLFRWGGLVFAVAVLFFNSPWGWSIQERVAERLADWWRVVRVNLLPGLVATILDWFRRLANWVERKLYAVDEWLRFRTGDSRSSVATKALLGLLWFPLAYLARFAFYLLIEPQINPVKHFPVVTVSHKVIFAQVPAIADLTGLSIGAVTAVIWLIPGIFGFIAWELLANWRLYRANRPDRLRPVVVGSHGETMRGLLRPGFHSGTVPKLFRKLRAADRRGNRQKSARWHHELEHAAEAVRRFVEREMMALLEACPEWGGLRGSVAGVRFGCQRVVVEIAVPQLGADAFALAFENRAGRIEASIMHEGWADKLTTGQRVALFSGLRGLFDMAAAELFEERGRLFEPGESAEPPYGPSYTDLSRPYRWNRWVERWEKVERSASLDRKLVPR